VSLEIKQLSVIYTTGDHSLLALDNVDLSVRPGKVTALVGESGSGKTTLGKALIGLLPENARLWGSARLDGTEIVGAREESLNRYRWARVAMVFQDGQAGLNPVHRIQDQLAEPLIQRLGFDRWEAAAAVERRLEEVGLAAGAARRYPHELSGGQIQRALFAMALAMDPEYLILDEPTSALDAISKSSVAGLINNLKGRGKGILLITHDLQLASALADHVALLYLGQVMETMPAADLLTEPGHPYTSALARSYPGVDTVRDLGGIRGDAFYRFVHVHSHRDGSVYEHSHVSAPGSIHAGGHAPDEGCLFLPRCTQSVEGCGTGSIEFVDAGTHRVKCRRGGIVDIMRLEGVSKSFGSTRALALTDLNLRAGEVFCLMGETGSGKTTLAMIAAAALAPDDGRRIFEGRDMDLWTRQDYKGLASRIGLIHQNPADAVSHRFSIFDIVAEPLRIQAPGMSKPEIRSRVLGALDDVRLSVAPEFLSRHPHELNMGAIQRVCIARALVQNPVLLVADEPTCSLDPSVQAKVLKMLLGLQIEKGLTMLMVTHDVGVALKVADRVGVMLAGSLVEVGPAASISNKPAHPYTEALLGSSRKFGLPGAIKGANGPREEGGCPFQPGCLRSLGRCRVSTPEMARVGEGRHQARCWHPLS